MIGIDISNRSIKIVQLTGRSQRRLEAFCSVDLPAEAMDKGVVQRPKVVRKKLKQMFSECEFDDPHEDTVVASIAESQSFLRVIELPAMAEDEVGEAIQWEIAQHIPFGLENVYLDWQPVLGEGHAGTEQHREVQVGAAQRKVIDALHDTLEGLDLDVAAFELESQAIARALVSSELREQAGLLIIDVGATAANVMVHDHGALRFSASTQRGVLDIARELPSAERELVNTGVNKLNDEQVTELKPKLQPGAEELVVEINSNVEFYNSIDAQHQVQQIILTGGGSALPGLKEAFLKYFEDVHVQLGNPWANLFSDEENRRAPMDISRASRYATAIGLSLRDVLV